MTKNPLLISLVAAAALAGCNQDHTITSGPDDGNAANAEANANVQLPPSIAASKIYRCGDNHVFYVDWLSDNKTANVRSDPNGTPTQVVAAEPGKPFTGGEYSLTGSAAAPSVTIVHAGSSQSCKA
jgi:hypothetical protein